MSARAASTGPQKANVVLGAIPYIGLDSWSVRMPLVGPVSIDPWALFVFAGFLLSLSLVRRRAIRVGLEPRDAIDGALWTVGLGFVVGHVVEVLAYEPARLRTEGWWTLLAFWQGVSSYGGFLGAVAGSLLFYKVLRPRDFLRHADVINHAFPTGWMLGRLGCTVVHDHLGCRTDFPLAMDFDHGFFGTTDPAPFVDGIRHELGLDEALFMVPVIVLFALLGRRHRVPGFFVGLFAVIYAPVRFGLDFLRQTDLPNPDTRWLGLTPAQYASMALLVAGLSLLATRDWKDPAAHALRDR